MTEDMRVHLLREELAGQNQNGVALDVKRQPTMVLSCEGFRTAARPVLALTTVQNGHDTGFYHPAYFDVCPSGSILFALNDLPDNKYEAIWQVDGASYTGVILDPLGLEEIFVQSGTVCAQAEVRMSPAGSPSTVALVLHREPVERYRWSRDGRLTRVELVIGKLDALSIEFDGSGLLSRCYVGAFELEELDQALDAMYEPPFRRMAALMEAGLSNSFELSGSGVTDDFVDQFLRRGRWCEVRRLALGPEVRLSSDRSVALSRLPRLEMMIFNSGGSLRSDAHLQAAREAKKAAPNARICMVNESIELPEA